MNIVAVLPVIGLVLLGPLSPSWGNVIYGVVRNSVPPPTHPFRYASLFISIDLSDSTK
jgi:hypothetical protein